MYRVMVSLCIYIYIAESWLLRVFLLSEENNNGSQKL